MTPVSPRRPAPRRSLMLSAALIASLPGGALADGAGLFSPWLPPLTPAYATEPSPERPAPGFVLSAPDPLLVLLDPGAPLLFALGLLRPAPPPEDPEAPAPAARSIFAFPLAGLWPTGVSAWLGLPPGPLLQTFGTLDQRARGNVASLRVLEGERIGATVWQGGFANLLGPVRLWGDDHSVSVRQDGTGNLGFIGALVGFAQSVGLRQLGTNIADIALAGFGEDNEVFIDQVGEGVVSLRVEGVRNSIHVRQDYLYGLGGDNMFRVEVDGAGNVLRVEQDGDNEITVTITGTDNNAVLRPGDALRDLGLLPGQLLQSGDGNRVVIEVLGSGNQFGSRQTGDGGSARITQSGDGNRAAVVQAGQGTSAVVSQTGSGNSVSVSQ